MTDHTAELRFDIALDHLDAPSPNGIDPLVSTARTMQSQFDRQHAIPSESFVTQLERTLFAPSVVPTEAEGPPCVLVIPREAEGPPGFPVIPSEAEGSPAAAVSRPQTRSGPARTRSDARWFRGSRIVAIAAVLALLIGGMGAILGGPFDPRSNHEPSAIPAASFASPAPSVEAAIPSPASSMSGIAWIAPPPDDTAPPMTSPEYAYAEGRIFRVFPMRVGWSHIQAVDTRDGAVLWDLPLAAGIDAIGTYDRLLLVASHYGATPGSNDLLALDAQTGQELWRVSLSGYPVDMKIVENRAFVLTRDNNLDAIDLDTHQSIYTADIGGRSLPFRPNQAYTTDHRLAAIDGTLAVVLADGSIAGIELDTGIGQWWVPNAAPGPAEVHAVNGTFVVLNGGTWVTIRTTEPAPTTPAPEGTAALPSCQEAIPVFTGEQILDSDRTAEDVAMISGLDPATGEPRWIGEKARDQGPILYSDTGVVVVASSGDDDPADASICSVNAATGEVSRIEQMADLSDRTFRMKFFSDVNRDLTVTILDDGRFLMFPAGLHSPVTNPAIDLGSSPWPGGITWIDVFDGATYLSLYDGRLIKVSSDQLVSTPSASVGTPQPPTPVASGTGWMVSPPAGTRGQSTPGMIANGAFYRVLGKVDGWPLIQAIDLASGRVLWEKVTDVWPQVIEATDDAVLIAGDDGGASDGGLAFAVLDGKTGDERWRAPVQQLPVDLLVADGRALVLGANNLLTAFDLASHDKVWEVDLTAFLEPSNDDATLVVYTGDRLAASDGVVAAVADEGSVVAIELQDGSNIWAHPDLTEGQTRLAIVDGKFTVVAMNPAYAGGWTSWRPGESTPPAEATPSPDFCSVIVKPVEPSAIDLDAESGNLYGIVALAPDTGEAAWSAVVQSWISLWSSTDSLLIGYYPSSGGSGVIQPDSFLCQVDGATGAATTVAGPIPDASGHFAYLDADGVPQGMAVLRDGTAFPVPIDETQMREWPLLDVDIASYGGIQSVQAADDAIYVSMRDGTLIKLANSDQT